MKTSTKIISGTVAAVAMAAAAALFLNSKTGKQLKKELKHSLGDFYGDIAPRIKKIKKMGHDEYKAFMKEAAERYGKARKMSEDKVKDLVKDAQDSWKHFAKHLGE